MLAKWLEIGVSWLVVLLILAYFGQYVFAILWIPVKTVQVHRRTKRRICPVCRAPWVKYWSTSVDHLYSSKTTHAECTNGHIYTSGNARFADWAGF